VKRSCERDEEMKEMKRRRRKKKDRVKGREEKRKIV